MEPPHYELSTYERTPQWLDLRARVALRSGAVLGAGLRVVTAPDALLPERLLPVELAA